LSVGVGKFKKRYHPPAVLREGRHPVLPVPSRAGGLYEEQHVFPGRPERHFVECRQVPQWNTECSTGGRSRRRLHEQPWDPSGQVRGVYIVTYDTEVNPRERVWHTRWRKPALKDFVKTSGPARLVMILDTCYSNAPGVDRGLFRVPPAGRQVTRVGDENEGYGVSTAQLVNGSSGPRTSSSRSAEAGLLDGEKHRSQESLRKGPSSAPAVPARNPGNRTSCATACSPTTSWTGMKRYDGSVKDAFDYSKPEPFRGSSRRRGLKSPRPPRPMGHERKLEYARQALTDHKKQMNAKGDPPPICTLYICLVTELGNFISFCVIGVRSSISLTSLTHTIASSTLSRVLPATR